MTKRSFFCLAKPRLFYESPITAPLEPKKIPVPDKMTFLIDEPYELSSSLSLKVGDPIKKGQKLFHNVNSENYAISTVSGTISSISPFIGNFGKKKTALTIEVGEIEENSEEFSKAVTSASLETIQNFLAFVPGSFPIESLKDPEKPVDTIVVCATDSDLMVETNQYAMATLSGRIKSGIKVLKNATQIKNILIAAPRDRVQGFGHLGAEVKAVDLEYPAAFPVNIMKDLLGIEVSVDKTCMDMGVCFLSAEAVASIGCAFDEGRIPTDKIITFVDKNGIKTIIQARIGTPIYTILKEFDIRLNEKDRVIVGGPMTGSAIYSDEYPVQADMDAIMIQDRGDLAVVSDYPCINCGDCIRICPAKIPVNMLIRFLEAGQYEDGAELYDLNSCIECGLCSFVCVAKIPIFQYIKLAKFELARLKSLEAENA